MDPKAEDVVPRDTQTPPHTSPPIFRLPTEILAEIFERTITLDQTEFTSSDVQLRHLVIVCRRWCTVIMACPRLWSSLVFTSVEVTALMLRRSKESSLVVRADLSYDTRSTPVLQAVLLALSNLSRIRALHIVVSTDTYKSLVAAMMDRPAPLLDSLRLIYWQNTHHRTLPPSLFAGITPRLRYIAFQRLDAPWHLPLLRNLTRLEIDCCTRPASLVAFQDVLSRCPALNTLIIRGDLPAASEQLQPPVALPLLSYLKLNGGCADCDAVIHSISFPSTTVVALCLNDGPQLSHLIAKLCDRAYTIALLRLEMGILGVTVRGWTTVDSDRKEDPPLDLQVGGLRVTPLRVFCKGFTQLVSLEVVVGFLTQEGWEAVFSTLQKLQVLTASSASVNGLISALMPEGAVPLPGLRKLTLNGVKTELTTIPDLLACLMLRRDNHADIETLRLSTWFNLRKVDVDMLRAALGIVVDWDGIELNY